MLKNLCFVILAFFFSYCSNVKKNEVKEDQNEEFFEFVNLIPDSLRTAEQNELFLLLQKTITENVQVKDNHLYFPLSEDEFVKLGIPVQYYKKLQQDMKDANDFIDSKGIKDVESILDKIYKHSKK